MMKNRQNGIPPLLKEFLDQPDIKEKFMEGGPEFMSIILLCLILGLGWI